ncbi:Secreted protein containing DUF1552 [Planctomycetales bacterium 10988]|nr:Secreted protein containing DUF1552 [Planctomycetales bacterium 10988]
MHQPIPRRTLLKGLGASLALPWLEAMTPTICSAAQSKQLSEPPRRIAYLFMPNGVRPDHWTPPGDGEKWEMTPMLKPLANVKDELILLENLWHEQTTGRNGHWPKVPAWLSGGFVVRTSGRDMDTGNISADQFLAQKIGMRTPLPSLELGVDAAYTGVDNIGGGFTRIYGSHIAWKDPHTPVPKEILPQLAFDRLFRSGTAGPVLSGFNPNTQAVNQSLQRDDNSVLDLVLEDAKSLQRKVSTKDRLKLAEYLESVRAVERQIENSMKPQVRWINEGKYELARPGQGIPEDHQEHVRLMLDIMMLAFWTDSTRIATFMFGNAQTGRNFSFIDGVKGSFHQLSHHRDEPKIRDQYEKIGYWHVEQVAYCLEKMKQLDEGGSSLLDNSMVLFGSSLKDGNRHDNHDLPLVLAGRGAGALRPGRRVRAEVDTPFCNLHLALIQRMGVEIETFGDSTASLKGLS